MTETEAAIRQLKGKGMTETEAAIRHLHRTRPHHRTLRLEGRLIGQERGTPILILDAGGVKVQA